MVFEAVRRSAFYVAVVTDGTFASRTLGPSTGPTKFLAHVLVPVIETFEALVAEVTLCQEGRDFGDGVKMAFCFAMLSIE